MTRVAKQAFACYRLMLFALFVMILRLMPCMIVSLGESYN